MMQLSQSAFPNLQSRSPILQKIGNIENLRIVNDAKVDLLSGDDDVNPGWWSSLTYPSNLNCNTTLAGLVTGIRTNLCVASSRESYFLYCNSANATLITYPNTECNHRKGTPTYTTESMKCTNNFDPDNNNDDEIYNSASYNSLCQDGIDFPVLPKLFAANRYYTDESCNNMISYTGYANDFCITTSPSTSYMVDYPSLTLYNASHDCSVYTKRGYAIFGPFSCASNPYTSNSEYLFNSQYYSSGLMQKEVTQSFSSKVETWGPGSIAAVALGVFIALVAIIVGVYFYYVRNKKNKFPSAYEKAEIDALNYPEFGGEVQEFQFSATY